MNIADENSLSISCELFKDLISEIDGCVEQVVSEKFSLKRKVS